LPGGDGARDLAWWLADCPYDGLAYHALRPIQGFCAETGGALTLFLATALGVAVSTTHTITGAIVGVGAARRTAVVRWPIAQKIVVAWVLTLPAAGLLGALAFKAVGHF
jgi:PiT family inorganic phosphate transporter